MIYDFHHRFFASLKELHRFSRIIFFVIQSVAKNLNTYTIAFQILPPFGRLDDKGRKG